MEMIEVVCMVELDNVKAILDLPQVKETGVSSADLNGIKRIVIDPNYLPLNNEDDRVRFKNSIIGAAVLGVMKWKQQQKESKEKGNNEENNVQ